MAEGGRNIRAARVVAAVGLLIAMLAVDLSSPTSVEAQTDGEVRSIDLGIRVRDAVADPVRPVFYATTSADEIVEIDVADGEIVRSLDLGGDPSPLAIAADGSALYVGDDATGTVEKRSLPDLSVEWTVQIEPHWPGRLDIAEDIEVSPAIPTSSWSRSSLRRSVPG